MRNRSDDFAVVIQAECIQQVVDLASDQYPDGAVRVVFPIDPDAFFAGDAAKAGPFEFEVSKRMVR